MTYLRDINTLEAAVRDGIERIGVRVVAKAVNRAPHRVGEWSRDDNPHEPTMAECLAIDAACEARGKGRPITEFMASCAIGSERYIDLTRAALELSRASGGVSDAIAKATDPSSPGGEVITLDERKACQAAIDEAQRAVGCAKSALADEVAS